MAKTLIAALLLAVGLGAPAAQVSAQIVPQTGTDLRTLETRLKDRFQILPIAGGVVLTPKFKSTVRAIEVADRTISVDGTAVTGPELRDRLGADAELIFQLSYLDPASRLSLLGLSPSSPAPPAAPEPAVQPERSQNPSRPVRRDDIVRFGGDVTITADEVVSGDVVVIGGSADINGEVDGEVAVIGGSLTLGPRSDVKHDVTVVGGKLNKDPSATIEGKLSEVGVGDAIRGRRNGGGIVVPNIRGDRNWGFNPVFGLAGTIVRLALLMLLAGIVLLVARLPVQQIADRAAAEPLKSWVVGFLAEILFVPVLAFTIFVLIVSIIGIPLLLLVPVAIVGVILVFMVGFTGVAYQLGRLVEERFEQVRNKPYLATFAGIVVILSPLLLARIIGLVGGLGVVVGILVAAGVVVEYIAWTMGVGAAALTRFGRPPVQVEAKPPIPIST